MMRTLQGCLAVSALRIEQTVSWSVPSPCVRRGFCPIACGIDAGPILNYTPGISGLRGQGVDHVVSVVGWGAGGSTGKYWIVRNSWASTWGEDGYIYLEMAKNTCGLANDVTVPEVKLVKDGNLARRTNGTDIFEAMYRAATDM